jgi:hypothetical protein
MQPTLAGFQSFIVNVMGINTTILPADSPVIAMALGVALGIVNQALLAAGCGPSIPGVPPISFYTLAVYNLAGSNLLSYAQDQPDAPNVPGSNPPAPFFQNLRQKWDLLGFVSGVVTAAGDEGTNTTLIVQEAAKNFTLANLQQLKDPYGRQYLAIAQSYGPSIVGLS